MKYVQAFFFSWYLIGLMSKLGFEYLIMNYFKVGTARSIEIVPRGGPPL